MFKYLYTLLFYRNYPFVTRSKLFDNDEIHVDEDGHIVTKDIPCHCKMCSNQRDLVSETLDILDIKTISIKTNRAGTCVVCHDSLVDIYACEFCDADQCERCSNYGHIHSNPTCESYFKGKLDINDDITPLQYVMRNVSTKCPGMSLYEWYYCPKIIIYN